VEQSGPGALIVTLDETRHEISLLERGGPRLRYRLDGVDRRCVALQDADGAVHVALADRIAVVREPALLAGANAVDPSRVTAPVSGAVVAVNVKPGDSVKAGDVLAVMEAMKMEMRLTAAADGVVAAVHTAPGQQAAGGALLIELEIEDKR
jgi:geranyl-CoA carboxylase alpha subunit